VRGRGAAETPPKRGARSLERRADARGRDEDTRHDAGDRERHPTPLPSRAGVPSGASKCASSSARGVILERATCRNNNAEFLCRAVRAVAHRVRAGFAPRDDGEGLEEA
jgi:hypothetical protein